MSFAAATSATVAEQVGFPWIPPPGSAPITDFGASPTKSAVDNQAAIQAALDTLPPLKSVGIPPGIFRTGPLVVSKSKTWITGPGEAAVLKAEPSMYIPNQSVGGSTLRTIGGLTEVVMMDFALDGAGTDTCFGVTIRDGTDAIVQRVTAYEWFGVLSQRARGLNVQRNGPSSAGPFRNVSFLNCVTRRCQIGYVMHWSNTHIAGCIAQDAPMDGFYIDGLEGRTTLVGNTAIRCNRAGFNLIVGWFNTLRQNRAEACATGIQIYDSRGNLVEKNIVVDGTISEGITLRANAIENVLRENIVIGQRGGGEGIFVFQPGTRDNLLEGNECYLNLRNGIFSNGAGPNIFRRNVSFNNGKGGGV